METIETSREVGKPSPVSNENEHARKYYEEQSEDVRAYKRRWNREHSDKVRAYCNNWRQKHSNEIKAYNQKYWKEHPRGRRCSSDEPTVQSRKYSQEQIEDELAQLRKWFQEYYAGKQARLKNGFQEPEENEELTKNYNRRKLLYRKKASYLEFKRQQRHERRRNLGFVPLNQNFANSNAHHLDKEHVVYIPIEFHKAIPHRQSKPETMKQINHVAWVFLEASVL